MRCSAPSLYELHGCSSKDNLNALNIQLNFEQMTIHIVPVIMYSVQKRLELNPTHLKN